METKPHGGARAGAGRKPSGKKPNQSVSVRLSPETIALLDKQEESRAVVVARGIELYDEAVTSKRTKA